MADLIYRGGPPVGAAATQTLLASTFAAVWSPPIYRHATPSNGDRLWLIWQARKEAPRLLGLGAIELTEDGRPYWTNRTSPGIVKAARDLGYSGPPNMAFLRISAPKIADKMPEIPGLGRVPLGLSPASPEQVATLTRLPTV